MRAAAGGLLSWYNLPLTSLTQCHGALQPFKHPATFATLALPDMLREQVLGKLHSFKQDADFYSRTGRAHKMGMLLHGPPGTGGNLLIAFAGAIVSQPQPVLGGL